MRYAGRYISDCDQYVQLNNTASVTAYILHPARDYDWWTPPFHPNPKFNPAPKRVKGEAK